MPSLRWATEAALALVLVLNAGRAAAQDLPTADELSRQCAPELAENRRRVLHVDGASGIWFDGRVASCMAARLRLLPAFANLVELQASRLELSDERYALQVQRAELAIEEAAAARRGLDAAEEGRRDALARLDAPWRAPWLWATLGVVIGAALVVAASNLTD